MLVVVGKVRGGTNRGLTTSCASESLPDRAFLFGPRTAMSPRESASESSGEAERPVHTANLCGESGQPAIHSSLSGVGQIVFHSSLSGGGKPHLVIVALMPSSVLCGQLRYLDGLYATAF